jgi:hypothetical protein
MSVSGEFLATLPDNQSPPPVWKDRIRKLFKPKTFF